ncbi:AAA family ATPase [Lachnospiraceae bacterium MD335]|nr:AAA family ATPase [Lachnospiraceae bacterium MD335]
MMKSKFFLKRLVLSGNNKKNAILNFEEGLNVIAGASDTGKSFAFDCINYGFGSSDAPALPPEAKGYNSVYLELETVNNDLFTIRRDFDDKGNAYWIYSKIEDIHDDTSFEKIKAESKTDKNISEKILSICGCNYKNLLKKISTGETKKFTFRDFIPLIMVNEGRITQKYSPVHRTSPRGNTLAVSEWTAFQTIVTGEDYVKTSKSESADVIKSRIKGQIQELELLCAELRTEIEELKEAVEGTSIDELDKRIEELQTVIDEKKEYLLSKEEEYCLRIKHLKEADYEKQRISDNVCKFHLLMENYKSDIERLDFIEEAHNVTEQLLDVECPVCHAISKGVIDAKQKELCHKAFLAEKRKTKILMADLGATLENAEINKTNIERENDKLLEDINRLVNDMNESLRPVIDSKLEEIRDLLEKRELWSVMYANDSKIKKYEDRISELESSREKVTNKSKGNIKDISEEKLVQFSEIVKKMLVSWNFIEEKSDVVFNKENKDFCIDGKRKELFGKGARAIINSAFLIGLMEYCYDNRLCHPGIVILDTPLTTFREKDADTDEKDESVGKDIKMAVYDNLATTCKDYQVIIFENEEPTKDLKNKINYIHFTGNDNVDRQGFITD